MDGGEIQTSAVDVAHLPSQGAACMPWMRATTTVQMIQAAKLWGHQFDQSLQSTAPSASNRAKILDSE